MKHRDNRKDARQNVLEIALSNSSPTSQRTEMSQKDVWAHFSNQVLFCPERRENLNHQDHRTDARHNNIENCSRIPMDFCDGFRHERMMIEHSWYFSPVGFVGLSTAEPEDFDLDNFQPSYMVPEHWQAFATGASAQNSECLSGHTYRQWACSNIAI